MQVKVLRAVFHGVAIVTAAWAAMCCGSYFEGMATFVWVAGFGVMPAPHLLDPNIGKFSADCVAGACAGREFIQQMIADRAFYRLALRVNELSRSGKEIGGFEVGFFTEIARHCAGATALSDYNAFDHGEHTIALDAVDEAAAPTRRDKAVRGVENS